MMNKKLRFCSFVLATVFTLGACSAPKEEVKTKAKEQKSTVKSDDINEYSLRDKNALYDMHDPSEIVTMYLTVSRGNEGENTDHSWEEINTYSAYDYDEMGVDRYKVEGLLQVGDENGPKKGEVGYNQLSPNCTVQIRGQTSSLNAQKNYKISLKENKGTWRGQSTIALNKHQGDGLRYRNKMVYDLITGIDQMMGLRTTFVHLYVKDTTSGSSVFKDYGLYTQVEQLNKTALKAHGLDKNGHLYKINYCEFYRYEDVIKLKDESGYDIKAFEQILEVKGSDDHKKLIKMLDEVNDYSYPMEKVLEKHFDIENLSYWMAFHILMGNIDTQSRNFYIYSPLHSDKWYILTWDNDASLKRTEYKLMNRIDGGGWESGVSNYWGNVLFQRCLKTEVFRKALDKAMEDLKGYLNKERIDSISLKYKNLLKPIIYSMPDSMHEHLSQSQYDIVAKSISGEIDTNYKLYKESFEKPMPFFIGIPQKNGGKLSFVWDNSYDFNRENVTYTFELSKSLSFANPIAKHENLNIAAVQTDMLPAGQYFIRVTATNESGKSMPAFDYYISENGKNYGVMCFYVNQKGEIVEDVYVES